MKGSTCRFCAAPLKTTFVDLGMSPLSNAYLRPEELSHPEPLYPLHAWVCDRCLLVQIAESVTPASLFTDYAYFSSFSDSWLAHARAFADESIARFGLGADTQVIEVASNDGYLLQYYVERGIPALGVEPAANVAAAAIARGISTRVAFFGRALALELAERGCRARLLVANNVLAHVPDVNDFVHGLAIVLESDGVVSIECPHLLQLVRGTQFDTIYHEHFSYFSLRTLVQVLARHGLRVFDLDELPTHGGSLRVYACRTECSAWPISVRVAEVLHRELLAGLHSLASHAQFAERVEKSKRSLLRFLIEARDRGLSVAGYGAPAKATTLLNYCGVGPELLNYTVDRSPHKQGKFVPGVRIPILAPDYLDTTRPDYVLILPWNLSDEIVSQLWYTRNWGCRFVVPIPETRVLD